MLCRALLCYGKSSVCLCFFCYDWRMSGVMRGTKSTKAKQFHFFVKFRTDFHDTFPCFKCMSERFRCMCAQNYEKRKVPCLYSPTTPTFDVSSSSSLQWLAPLIDRTCSFALIFINNLRFICRQPDRGSHSPNIRKMTKNSIATSQTWM